MKRKTWNSKHTKANHFRSAVWINCLSASESWNTTRRKDVEVKNENTTLPVAFSSGMFMQCIAVSKIQLNRFGVLFIANYVFIFIAIFSRCFFSSLKWLLVLNSIEISFIFRANNAKINFREKEKKVLDQILGQGKYDARIRPSGINGTGKWFLLCWVFSFGLKPFYFYFYLLCFFSRFFILTKENVMHSQECRWILIDSDLKCNYTQN